MHRRVGIAAERKEPREWPAHQTWLMRWVEADARREVEFMRVPRHLTGNCRCSGVVALNFAFRVLRELVTLPDKISNDCDAVSHRRRHRPAQIAHLPPRHGEQQLFLAGLEAGFGGLGQEIAEPAAMRAVHRPFAAFTLRLEIDQALAAVRVLRRADLIVRHRSKLRRAVVRRPWRLLVKIVHLTAPASSMP